MKCKTNGGSAVLWQLQPTIMQYAGYFEYQSDKTVLFLQKQDAFFILKNKS